MLKAKQQTNMLFSVLQPTKKDIEDYKAYVKHEIETDLERERIKQEKDDIERERVYQEKLSRRKLAIKLEQKYPIKENDKFYVKLGFSEHPGVEEKKMSLKAANKFLSYLDREIHLKRKINKFWGWYDKTDFEIYDSENDLVYKGRYDLGDGEYGIIAHIYNYAYNNPLHDLESNEKKRFCKKINRSYYRLI